jgi:hypothetical protein
MLPSKYNNRREFLKTCLRFGIGGGLVFTGITLGLRKKNDNTENDSCQISSPCRGCLKYNGCSLPRALDVKKSAERKGGSSGRK